SLTVEADAGSYDVNTTPAHMFSTSLGTVTFKPGAIKFFYDPTAKSLSALAPPPPLPARLCSASQAGPLDAGPIRDAASLAHRHRLRLRQRESVGSGAGRGVDSLLNQETKDALSPAQRLPDDAGPRAVLRHAGRSAGRGPRTGASPV